MGSKDPAGGGLCVFAAERIAMSAVKKVVSLILGSVLFVGLIAPLIIDINFSVVPVYAMVISVITILGYLRLDLVIETANEIFDLVPERIEPIIKILFILIAVAATCITIFTLSALFFSGSCKPEIEDCFDFFL